MARKQTIGNMLASLSRNGTPGGWDTINDKVRSAASPVTHRNYKAELLDLLSPSSSWGGGKGTILSDEYLRTKGKIGPGVVGKWLCGVDCNGIAINCFFPTDEQLAVFKKSSPWQTDCIVEVCGWRYSWCFGNTIYAIKHGIVNPEGVDL